MSLAERSGKPVEIELKYRVVDAAAGDRYLTAESIAGFRPTSAVRSAQVEDRYIDTADGAMARAGFAARLRQSAKMTTVGVKSSVRRVGTGNVHRREELEGPADRTAHPRDWPPSDARSLILEQCGDAPLVEVVTIRQLRRKRILELDGTSVELSLDEVDAVSRSRVVGRFVELEVELKTGDEAGLAAIDRELAADPGLAPADTSKLRSALRAVAAAEPKRGPAGASALAALDHEASAGPPSGSPIAAVVEAVLAELDSTAHVADPPRAVERADGGSIPGGTANAVPEVAAPSGSDATPAEFKPGDATPAGSTRSRPKVKRKTSVAALPSPDEVDETRAHEEAPRPSARGGRPAWRRPRPRRPRRCGRRLSGRPSGRRATGPRAPAGGLAPASRRRPAAAHARAGFGRLPALAR
ncbi:MAG: hypothetical protein NVS9B8_02410 [Candidatus Limnocylindrales bacterium]